MSATPFLLLRERSEWSEQAEERKARCSFLAVQNDVLKRPPLKRPAQYDSRRPARRTLAPLLFTMYRCPSFTHVCGGRPRSLSPLLRHLTMTSSSLHAFAC